MQSIDLAVVTEAIRPSRSQTRIMPITLGDFRQTFSSYHNDIAERHVTAREFRRQLKACGAVLSTLLILVLAACILPAHWLGRRREVGVEAAAT